MEIERKYLVKEIPNNLNNFESAAISQSYISTDPTIRLRKSNDDYILTMKGKGNIAREEYELKITKEQYEKLLLKTEDYIICKTRYFIPIKSGLVAELDIFHERLNGLVTVEVEFASLEEPENFVAPSWFGEDVSKDKKYKNSFLSKLEKWES